ncbi:ABC transporter ATP-binding protein [Actinomadura verrucosospora]
MTPQPGPLPPPAISLKDVTRTYGHGDAAVHALNGVSIDFGPGTLTAVMGPSGSGKSTLLHCAAGLERVDSGRVLVDETDITHASDADLTALRRSRIGFLFQSYNLLGSLTAEENVALPLKLARASWTSADVRRALDEVVLSGRTGHRPRQLSGGRQQRVAIARLGGVAMWNLSRSIMTTRKTDGRHTGMGRSWWGAVRFRSRRTGGARRWR